MNKLYVTPIINIFIQATLFFSILCCKSYGQVIRLNEEKVMVYKTDFENSSIWRNRFEIEGNQIPHSTHTKTIELGISNFKNNVYELIVFPNQKLSIEDYFGSLENEKNYFEIVLDKVPTGELKIISNNITITIKPDQSTLAINEENLQLNSFQYPLKLTFVIQRDSLYILQNNDLIYETKKTYLNNKIKLKFEEGVYSFSSIESGYFQTRTDKETIDDYVKINSEKWIVRGKYEPSSEYEARVNEKTLILEKERLRKEIINMLASSQIVCTKISNNYDPDSKIFTLHFSNLNDVYVKIPIEEAKEINDNFCIFKFSDSKFDYKNEQYSLIATKLTHLKSGKQYYAFADFESAISPNLMRFDDVVTKTDEFVAVKFNEVKNYALIISVSNYKYDDIRDLNEPLNDANKLKDVLLRKYTFYSDDIIQLTDPTNKDIIIALDKLTKLVTEKDNLLIFYAGHGVWDQTLKSGYWLPSDAQQNSRVNWFSNSLLKDYIGGIKSRHTLLITDACFSGGIFKTREAFTEQRGLVELYKLPSRKAITSGALTSVPDKSVFMKYLLNRLEMNTSKTLSASSLFTSFRIAVINNSPNNQIPLYGDIKETGDEGGDFIFIQK